MDENSQETRSIEDLMKMIDAGKLVLPEFQREFKWPIEKTVTLFDSINRNLFIGSLILARPKFDLACKDFDLRERGSKKHRPKPQLRKQAEFESKDIYTLLDGQQRATSIYRALKGPDKIYYWFQDFETLCSNKFYDYTNKKNILGLEYYISNVDLQPPKGNILSVVVADLYKALEYREQKFIEDYINPQLDNFPISNEQKEIAREFAGALFSDFKTEIIKKQKLLSVQLLNMPLEKFCLFFERSNSQGMNLSFVDIINAKVYIDFKLSREITDAKTNFSYFDDKIVDPVIRYINYLANGEVTKDSILRDLVGSHLKTHWLVVAKDIDYIQKWLEENNWVFQVTQMPYRTMLLPLLSFYQNLPNKEFTQASQEQMDQLKYWFYGSLMDNRYGGGGHGSTNVVIKKDCDILTQLAKGKKVDKEFWAKIRITADFETYKRIDNAQSASFIGLSYFLWHQNNFKNFENNNVVSMSANVDIHHVFPVEYIKSEFGENSDEYDFVDSVLNKVRINKISNIKIGKKSPYTYLSEIKDKFNSNIIKSLETHNINCGQELLSGELDKRLFDFMKKRYDGLKAEIDKIINAGQKLSNGETENIWS
jgi:hypothetical protein